MHITDWKRKLLFVFMLLLLAGALVSRALLSISMIGFVLVCCVHKDFGSQLKTFYNTPLLIGMSLLFFIPFISGAWSSDHTIWWSVAQVKLPFFLLPLAFAGSWQLPVRQWRLLGWAFIVLVTAATCWSVALYLADSAGIQESYLRAKTLPTPMKGDHVRFSWMVCIAVITCMLLQQKTTKKSSSILLFLLFAWLIVYLHILAARTGLFACYLFLFVLLLHQLWIKHNRIITAGIAVVAVALPLIAWYFFPTFQNRWRYIRYDHSFVQKDIYRPGGNDGNRILSVKAGWDILKHHPLGVGAGDVRQHTNAWYATHVPGMLESDKIFPSNEWLVYGCFSGWPAVLLFTFIFVIPFFILFIRQRFYWYCLHGVAVFGFLFDTSLEVQFGIFLYAFITLWWWKWLKGPVRTRLFSRK